MALGLRTVVYPVDDLDRAKAVYGALLGADPVLDAPYYVQYDVGGVSVGLDPHGRAAGITAPVGYWHVDDVAATLEAVTKAGGRVHQEARDVGGGKLVATFTDAEGNLVGLIQDA